MKKILIMEDEENIRNLLKDFFSDNNFLVKTASNGEDGIIMFSEDCPDLLIVDVMMPKVDGWNVVKHIRETSNIPIIMLTAKSEEHDELYGFNIGVTDYVKKPFSLSILLARVNSRLDFKKNIFEIGNLIADFDKNIISINNKPVSLSKTELNLLRLLLENKNKVIEREFIIQKLWGYDYFGYDRTVDTHITRLRRKLGKGFNNIKTIRGFGYLLEVKNEIN